MGALLFAMLIISLAALADKLLPEKTKAKAVRRFLERGEKFGSH